MMQRDVRAEDAGKTIIQIVRAWLHPSKKMLATLKWNKGRILCNGIPVRTDHVPHPGDRISVILEDMPRVTTDQSDHTTDMQHTTLCISEDVSYPSVQSFQSLAARPRDQTCNVKILYETSTSSYGTNPQVWRCIHPRDTPDQKRCWQHWNRTAKSPLIVTALSGG